MSEEVVFLGDVCEVKRGTTITQKEAVPGDIPVIAGGLTYSYTHNVPNRMGKVITVSGSGANAGFVNFWSQPIFASDCSTIQPKSDDFDIRFIYYFLKKNQEFIYNTMRSGAAQPHVYAKDLAKIKIPLLPLTKQKRIVTILDKVATIQPKRELILANLDKLARSLFNEIYLDSNSTLKLCEVSEIVSGGTPKTGISEYWDGVICWVTPAELSSINSCYISKTARNITDKGLKNSSAKILPVNSVLFSSRAPIGHIAINTVPMATNQGFKSFIVNTKIIEPTYLYYWLDSKRKYLQSLGVGATFKELSKSAISDVLISFPSIEIQRAFSRKLDSIHRIKLSAIAASCYDEEIFQSVESKLFSTGFN